VNEHGELFYNYASFKVTIPNLLSANTLELRGIFQVFRRQNAKGWIRFYQY